MGLSGMNPYIYCETSSQRKLKKLLREEYCKIFMNAKGNRGLEQT
jgi:hypothetical protein